MQVKYISEKTAIERLEEATGETITESIMEELSSTGVVPAYMVFRPIDKVTFPGNRFFFVDCGYDEVSALNGAETELRILPYPLREGGIFKAAEWAHHGKGKLPTLQTRNYRVFAARADGQLEPIGEQHFVKVYAPLEIRPAAKHVMKYLAGGVSSPTIHSYCEEFAGFDIETIGEWRGMSPFTDDPDYFNPNRTGVNKVTINKLNESKRSELITISALLQIIGKISTTSIKRKLTQTEIINKALEIFPTGIKQSTLEKLFKEANKTRNSLIADARQRIAEQAEIASLEQD